MKRFIFALIILCLTLGFSGCADESMVQLTDEESKQIAEFSAYLLLKHNKNYEDGLIFPPTPTPFPTSAVKPTPTQGAKPTGSPIPTPTEEPEDEWRSKILEFLADDGLKLSYWGCEMAGIYTNGAVSVTPSNGNKLWIAKFIAVNTSSEDIKLNMLEKDFSAYIKLGDGKKVMPENTLLLNDFQTAELVIKAKTKQELVMIFNVPEKYTMKDAVLDISNKKTSAGIYLTE